MAKQTNRMLRQSPESLAADWQSLEHSLEYSLEHSMEHSLFSSFVSDLVYLASGSKLFACWCLNGTGLILE